MATPSYPVDLKVRASEKEAQAIRSRAKKTDLSVSRYLATVGAGKDLLTRYDHEALAELLYQIKRLGANVNQLARAAQHTPTTTLMVRRSDGPTNDLARLRGARFVSAVETGDGRRLNEALVKQVTGGEPVSARYLYGEFFEYHPSFKLFLATNHKPEIRGTDEGIWRRIHLVPFTVTIPQSEQDRGLLGKLKAEAPGILVWALEGCLAWQKEGLNPPPAVVHATNAYRAEMDTLVESSTKFGAKLRERGFERVRRKDGNYYKGIT